VPYLYKKKTMDAKKVSDSLTTFTEIVMPNDTNSMHNLMGGNLLKWMDIASGICGGKHANRLVVTAAVDNVSFNRPIHIGDVVTIQAQVTRVFNTSMEIFIEVHKENFRQREKVKCNEAYYTFVALDDDGRPVECCEVIPETDEEKHRYERALRRRELRLILAGRLKPEDAKELKEIFLG
jgi:acyl-CoA hydrolase